MISVKRLLAYAMIIGAIFAFVGCSSGSNGSSSSSPSAADSGQQVSSKSSSENSGELPNRPADLQGKVKQIRGNQLTVYRAEITAPELTEEEKAKRRETMQQLSPEERAKAREERFKVTDEAIELTIPVGIPIVSTQNVGGKLTTENLNLADIKQGDFIKFWFAGGGSTEIIYLQLNKAS